MRERINEPGSQNHSDDVGSLGNATLESNQAQGSPTDLGVGVSVAEQMGLTKSILEALSYLAVGHLDLVRAHEQLLERLESGVFESDIRRFLEEHEDRLFDLLAVLEGLDARVPDIGSVYAGFRSNGFVELPEHGPESELFLAMIDNCLALNALAEACLQERVPEDLRAFLEDSIKEEDANRSFFERALRMSQTGNDEPRFDESGESRDLTH